MDNLGKIEAIGSRLDDNLGKIQTNGKQYVSMNYAIQKREQFCRTVQSWGTCPCNKVSTLQNKNVKEGIPPESISICVWCYVG